MEYTHADNLRRLVGMASGNPTTFVLHSLCYLAPEGCGADALIVAAAR